jgi:hypothetical protein
MSERAVAYDANPNIPSRWLRFLYRVAGLEHGRVYTITLIVPSTSDSEPQWAISAEGKIENGDKRGVFLGQSIDKR